MTPPDWRSGPGSDRPPMTSGDPNYGTVPPDTRWPGEGNAFVRALRSVWHEISYFFLVPLTVLVVALIPLSIYYGYLIHQQYGILDSFCSAEVRQDYLDAAALLSPAYLGRTNPAKFEQANQERDQQLGPIQSCSVSGRNNLYISFMRAEFTLKVVIRGTSYQGTVHLVSDGQDWSIDDFDPALRVDTP